LTLVNLTKYAWSDLGREMTTSVVKNSVFRTFFEKEKLIGANFIDWYQNLHIMPSVEDKLTYLEHPIPFAHVPAHGQVLPQDVLAAHATLVKASKEIDGLMFITMVPELQKNPDWCICHALGIENYVFSTSKT
nr:zinc finger, CCHC-type [Tanacetum cinerariifolium]